jgi:prevent-host-death family protein
MEKIIPISELQAGAKAVVDGVKRSKNPVIITQRGRPAALIVDYEAYESMIHTLDEMTYPDWQDRLKEAELDSRRDRGISLEKIKKKLPKNRG